MEWRKFGNYEVSEDGQVRRAKDHAPMHILRRPKGYLYTQLVVNGKQKAFRIHRLVAHLWLGLDLASTDQVDHIDNDPSNNHWSNLQIVSASIHNHLTNKRLWPLDSDSHKQCRKCLRLLARSEFYVNRRGIDLNSSWCRQCTRNR